MADAHIVLRGQERVVVPLDLHAQLGQVRVVGRVEGVVDGRVHLPALQHSRKHTEKKKENQSVGLFDLLGLSIKRFLVSKRERRFIRGESGHCTYLHLLPRMRRPPKQMATSSK